MYSILDRAPASIVDATARYNLGELLYDKRTGDIYRYILHSPGSATSSVVGKLACNKAAGTRGVVTMLQTDVTSGTLGTITKIAGVYQAVLTLGQYGVVLVSSDYTDVYTDDGVVDGDYLVCDGGATETFIADTAVAGEEHGIFGLALAADNDTTHLVKAAVFGLI